MTFVSSSIHVPGSFRWRGLRLVVVGVGVSVVMGGIGTLALVLNNDWRVFLMGYSALALALATMIFLPATYLWNLKRDSQRVEGTKFFFLAASLQGPGGESPKSASLGAGWIAVQPGIIELWSPGAPAPIVAFSESDHVQFERIDVASSVLTMPITRIIAADGRIVEAALHRYGWRGYFSTGAHQVRSLKAVFNP